jgi:hypothetical protein
MDLVSDGACGCGRYGRDGEIVGDQFVIALLH